MNGERTAVMNELAGEQKDSLDEPQQPELSSPQFDETAVAVAQPVEPLPSRRFRLSNLALEPIAIVVAFGVVLIMVATAAGFLTIRSQQVRVSEQAAVGEPASPAVQPPQAEPNAADTTGPAKAAAAAVGGNTDPARSRGFGSRPHQRQRIALPQTGEGGRPAARKIGEIRYERSSDRPR